MSQIGPCRTWVSIPLACAGRSIRGRGDGGVLAAGTVVGSKGVKVDVRAYFETLSQETAALKNRVRHLIAGAHWQTDGEWKESVVRQILKRHLPATVIVGRGFVVTSTGQSGQLDVLLHDASKPVLFKDGDLVFVTPDAVIGIVEVKAKASTPVLRSAAKKLATTADLIRKHPNSDAFAGFFAFECDAGLRPQRAVDTLAAVASSYDERLDFACLGESSFVRYWNEDPETGRHPHKSWHAYNVPRLATGYFMHNVVDAISPDSVFRNRGLWFPEGGKESFRSATAPATWA